MFKTKNIVDASLVITHHVGVITFVNFNRSCNLAAHSLIRCPRYLARTLVVFSFL